MKLPVFLSAVFAASLLVGVATPVPADAACYGHNCYYYGKKHYKPYKWSHKHWNRYYSQDYRQWREYGGTPRDWDRYR
jgi:hypothetical protein